MDKNNNTEAQESKVIIESTDGSQTVIDVLDSNNTGVALDTSNDKADKNGFIGWIIMTVAVAVSAVIGWCTRGISDKHKAKKAAKEAEAKEMEEFRKFKAEQQKKAETEESVEVKAEDVTVEEQTEKKPEKVK